MTDIVIVPFIPAHLNNIRLHSYMGYMQEHVSSEEYANMLVGENSFTGVKDDGEVLGSAGIIQLGINRWAAWALLTASSGKHMLKFAREVKKFLDNNTNTRVETHVRHDFPQGHKLMKVLGFENETPNGMKNYGEEGMTYDLYARTT